MQAVSCVPAATLSMPRPAREQRPGLEFVVTESGIRVPVQPRPAVDAGWLFTAPKGREKGEAW